MIATNLEQQVRSTELQAPVQTDIHNLHAALQAPTHIYNYQSAQHPPKTFEPNHRFLSSFEMDADFWQQARGGPFGLHTTMPSNNLPHHAQDPHQQHHQAQPPPPPHHLTDQTTPTRNHINQNTTSIPQDDNPPLSEHQHHHQQQHHHHLQHHHQQQQQNLQHHHLHDDQHQLQHQHSQHSHLTHLGNEHSHHLLFNAAAAAAAAAHLSGVVKSNELSDMTAANNDCKVVNNNNNNNSSNNNNSDHIEQRTVATKQEPRASISGSNSLGVYSATNATANNTNNNNHNHSQQVIGQQQQQHTQLHHQEHRKHLQQHSLKFEQEPTSPGSLPLKALQHQIQQQIQQHTEETTKILNGTENQKPENQSHQHAQQLQQHHFHNIHTQHQQLPVTTIDNKSTHCDQQQMTITTTALTPTSPLRISSLVHHQTPTSSPQPSLTSPSAGSSTPDLKPNSDNNKLPNELQLQLSRSNSAAAISERTLEECWSTLQRLFMHKSAMQQMQQQIPRTGLGPGGGTGGIGAESKPHQCQQCMKSFSSNHQLVQHIRVHTGEKPYKCSYCDRRFKQLSHVQQHTRLHTGERPYKCHLPECGRAFIQLSNLQQHLRNHDAQVERAKNRPFHCNICGKGFATESSLRTHTSKELQLHLGVLQQHAALIGGPNATSCPICHKLFLGTDALMEHMKHVHKEKTSQLNNNPFIESVCGSTGNNLSNAGSSSCLQSSGASSSNDPYSAKRRNANHPCPVCGKHYVNEGSLRKHLACHAETSQLTNSLRMWPCSVCQAVFTYENGLLTHMEHMRMDPKHQFAAQYVLSRAAAERRDRDNILAATLAASSGSSAAGGLIPLLGEASGTGGGGSNSLCPSPSANSECSSNGRLSSSAASDPGSGIHLLNSNNNNNTNNNNNSNNNNNNNHANNNCNNSNSNLSLSSKLNDILRTGNNTNHPLCAPPVPHSHNPQQNHSHAIASHGYGGIPGVDADLQNRMSLMAAASAAAAAVAASANNTSVAGLSPPQRFGIESTHPTAGNSAVQAAVVNLAAAMRLNHATGSSSSATGGNNNDISLETDIQQTPNASQTQPNGAQNHHLSGRAMSPVHHQGLQDEASTAVMNAMRDSMMRTTMMETSTQEPTHHQQHESSGHTTYDHANNTNMTTQQTNHHHNQQHQIQQPTQHLQQNATASGVGTMQHLHQHHNQTVNNPLQTAASSPTLSSSHLPETALHMQQQAEAILRSHTEAAFRLAASVVQQQSNEVTTNNNNNNNNNNTKKYEQTQKPPQQQTKNTLTEENSQQKIHLNQNTQDISEVIRLQEHRLEQALRLHNDARTFNFLNPSGTSQQQQQQQQIQHQQLNNPTNHTNSNTSNTTQPPQQLHHAT